MYYRPTLRVSTFVLGLLVPLTAVAGQYTFTRIADSNDGVFDPFSFQLPSLNDSGQVAFKAQDMNTFVTGIFRGSGGPLTPIADNAGSIGFIGNFPSLNNSGAVSFAATVSGGNEEIFRGDGGPLTIIASTSGPTKFFSFNTFMNNNGLVAWQAELDNFDEGLFTGNGGPVNTIFLTSTSPFNDSFSSPSVNDSGQIAFEAGRDVGDRGIFRFEPGSGLFTTIVTDTGNFSTPDDRPSLNAGGQVAFHSLLFGGTDEGIFVGDGGPITTIADSTGPFQFFDRPSLNDSGQVAFTATLDNGVIGLFDGPDPVTNLVLASGESFDGGIISNIAMSREGLNNLGELSFLVQFDAGRTAIYRATIPEPATSAAILLGPGLLMRRCRGRRHEPTVISERAGSRRVDG